MNVMFLSEDPEECARFHCDKHVPNQIREYAQILSTAAYEGNFHAPERMYKPVPDYNPVIMGWASESQENFVYLLKLANALFEEHERRYGTGHKSYRKVISKMDISEVRLPSEGEIQGPYCVPDYCVVEGDPVQSYRNAYIYEKDWSMSWSNREVPDWYEPNGKVNDIPTQG
jgi:hypothetical protein